MEKEIIFGQDLRIALQAASVALTAAPTTRPACCTMRCEGDKAMARETTSATHALSPSSSTSPPGFQPPSSNPCSMTYTLWMWGEVE